MAGAFSYRGEFGDDEMDSLWTPLWWWWNSGPAEALIANRIVHAELCPGDMTLYEITVAITPYAGRPLAVSVFSPYNLCAVLPLVSNSATPEPNEYALGKFRTSGKGIPKAHRCARLLVSRVAGLASDTLAAAAKAQA